MSDSAVTTYRYCGRLFTADQIQQIRALIASKPKRNRAQLSRLVCDQLEWFTANGRRKEMSCRVAMLRMHREGLIRLPAPQKGNGNGRHRPRRRPIRLCFGVRAGIGAPSSSVRSRTRRNHRCGTS